MSFANPAALWCLLALPAVLAVHFLQKRGRRQVVTTLFLLEALRRQPAAGRRLERLRGSIPLWMQLLMVLILTWLLASPRWLRQDAVLRLAFVLDASASMSAFRAEAETAVTNVLRSLPETNRAELVLLSSDPAQPALYHGGSISELLSSLPGWQPLLGVHDFSPALRTARSLVGARGAVVLVTDHTSAEVMPQGAERLSVGHEKANVGWSGATVEDADGQPRWRALMRNYGRTPQTREWRVEAPGGTTASPWTQTTLGPGETRAMSGLFPPQVEELVLRLQSDALPLDDALPLLIPHPKILALHLPMPQTSDGSAELRDLLKKLPSLRPASHPAQADVRGLVWPPSIALEPGQNAVAFASPPKGEQVAWLRGQIVAEAHPLVEGLNWQSLLAAEGMVIPHRADAQVLLWQGTRPLISLLRTSAGAQHLFCHFDLVRGNALKLPATAILLHRFLSTVRQEKIALESANFDTGQRLRLGCATAQDAAPLVLSARDGGGTTAVPAAQAHLLRAPASPGFFQVSQGDQILLHGAAAFADVREADLSTATPQEKPLRLVTELTEEALEADPLTPLWLLLFLAALLVSWWYSPSARLAASAPSPAPAP